ncbi:hypothetical protein [Pseudomonas syringae]|uniref:hypothetical protein n=1 Tax=Pseudomonas syringae TaxID=317 RepID=UPI001F1E72B8|nr:hypothetical protein [Pseudomonas syringae]MCF5371967.1 hypothetical protein [Pseudomonas syringae]
MKTLFNSITNRSTMLTGFSYDRTGFLAKHVWTRSLLSGAISTTLTGIGVYSGFLAMDAQFGAALGDQALNLKLGAGTLIACLLGYSLRDLGRSIIEDVKTDLRVARANSWLLKGSARTHDYASHIAMQETQLSMVRFVDVDGGIKVYAIARHQEHPNPIMIEAVLFDTDYPALAHYYTHPADIRSTLAEACGEWSGDVADQLGIVLSPDLPQARSSDVGALEDDASFIDSIGESSPSVFGRSSVLRGEALRGVSERPTGSVAH